MYTDLSDEEKEMIEKHKTEGEAPSVSVLKSIWRIVRVSAALIAIMFIGYYFVLLISYWFQS